MRRLFEVRENSREDRREFRRFAAGGRAVEPESAVTWGLTSSKAAGLSAADRGGSTSGRSSLPRPRLVRARRMLRTRIDV